MRKLVEGDVHSSVPVGLVVCGGMLDTGGMGHLQLSSTHLGNHIAVWRKLQRTDRNTGQYLAEKPSEPIQSSPR